MTNYYSSNVHILTGNHPVLALKVFLFYRGKQAKKNMNTTVQLLKYTHDHQDCRLLSSQSLPYEKQDNSKGQNEDAASYRVCAGQ